MNAADAATVAAAAAAGLIAGRAASPLAARLLAVPRPGGGLTQQARTQQARTQRARTRRARTQRARTRWARTRWALTLGTGLACAVMALRFGPSPPLPAFCCLAGIGVPLAMIDARTRRLPDALTLPAYPVALVLLGLAAMLLPGGGGDFLSALLGLVLALGVFLLQVLLYPAGLGWGDVKLSGLLGLYLGWLGISTLAAGLFLGYLLAASTGLALIATRRASRKSLLPFGPFLLIGAFVAVVLSGQHGWP